MGPRADYYWNGEPYFDYELEKVFEEQLNETYEPVKLFDRYEYDYGRVVREIDPTLFREAFLEWLNAEMEEGTLTEA